MSSADINSISDEERKKLEAERLRAEYETGPDYARWKRRRAMKNYRFMQSVAEQKPFFDFLGMTLKSALLFGLATFLYSGAPLNAACGHDWPWTMVPVLVLACLTALLLIEPTRQFSHLISADIAISRMMPFKRRRGSSTAEIYVFLLFVHIAVYVCIVTVAVEVASQATSGKSAVTCVPTAGTEKNAP